MLDQKLDLMKLRTYKIYAWEHFLQVDSLINIPTNKKFSDHAPIVMYIGSHYLSQKHFNLHPYYKCQSCETWIRKLYSLDVKQTSSSLIIDLRCRPHVQYLHPSIHQDKQHSIEETWVASHLACDAFKFSPNMKTSLICGYTRFHQRSTVANMSDPTVHIAQQRQKWNYGHNMQEV